jgi:hypothetical protein
MPGFNDLVTAQALLRVGRPFTPHGGELPCVADNPVQDDPRCRYVAVDRNGEGFSCDGLIRRAVCEAAGVTLDAFSLDYTHVGQWANLAEARTTRHAGLIVILLHKRFDVATHAAIQMDGDREILHATNEN